MSARAITLREASIREAAGRPGARGWRPLLCLGRICTSCLCAARVCGRGPPRPRPTDDEQLRRARRAPARRKGSEAVALSGRGTLCSVEVLGIAVAHVDRHVEELAALLNDIKGSFAEVVVSAVATKVSTSPTQLLEWGESLEASAGRVLAHGGRLCRLGWRASRGPPRAPASTWSAAR